MRKPEVGIMLGAGLAAAVWIGFGAASAESVEGSIRGGDNRTETSQESSLSSQTKGATTRCSPF
jgi:hypothetical protein